MFVTNTGRVTAVPRRRGGAGGHGEGRVAQAVAEGEQDRLGGEGLEVPVADEDVLCVVAGGLVAEAAGRGVVLVAVRHGVGQAPARLGLPGQDGGDGPGPLHAPGPCQQDGADARVPGPGQVHDVARVDDHDDPFEGAGHALQ